MDKHVKNVIKIFIIMGLSLVFATCYLIFEYKLGRVDNDFRRVDSINKIEFKTGDTPTSKELKDNYPDVYKKHLDVFNSFMGRALLDNNISDAPYITDISINENSRGEMLASIIYICEMENDSNTAIRYYESIKLDSAELYQVSIDCYNYSDDIVDEIRSNTKSNRFILEEDDGDLYKNLIRALSTNSDEYKDVKNKDGEVVWKIKTNSTSLENGSNIYSFELIKDELVY